MDECFENIFDIDNLSKESANILSMLEEDDDLVSMDECFTLLSELLGVSEKDLREKFRNIKEGLI